MINFSRLHEQINLLLIILCTVCFFSCSPGTQVPSVIPAFPGAEGFGAYASGGRGGKVIEVTNLKDDGPGSLRAAIHETGPRTIVFRVSGIIELESPLRIRNGGLTIAGQTAPGDGICIKNYETKVDADNVIIRFMRFRMGDEKKYQGDALGGRRVKNVIIDHCSMSWSIDETTSFYENDSTTIQWCIISESLHNSFHKKGPHGYGGIWGGRGASFHHNLFAHHTIRNPRFASGKFPDGYESDLVDFRYNVIYNWGDLSIYGGEKRRHNIVDNYFKPGPATIEGPVQHKIILPYYPYGKFFIDNNFMYGFPLATEDNWAYGVWKISEEHKAEMRQEEPYPVAPISHSTAEKAYEEVIAKAGAILPRRDPIDQRIIKEVISGTATYGTIFRGGGKGIIDSQKDVGGWPEYKTYNVPVDSDKDGMPDTWEISQGLNPNDPEDRNHIAKGEIYTNLERYLNSLALK